MRRDRYIVRYMSISNLLSGRSPAFDVSGTLGGGTACGVNGRATDSAGAIDAPPIASTFVASSLSVVDSDDASDVGDADDVLLGTSFSTLVSVFIIASQGHAILFCHSGMSVALRGLDSTLIRSSRFISLARSFVRAGQHAEGVSFVVRRFEVTIQSLDQLLIAAGFLVLLREAEHHHRVARIGHEHLLEDVDARCGHEYFPFVICRFPFFILLEP